MTFTIVKFMKEKNSLQAPTYSYATGREMTIVEMEYCSYITECAVCVGFIYSET